MKFVRNGQKLNYDNSTWKHISTNIAKNKVQLLRKTQYYEGKMILVLFYNKVGKVIYKNLFKVSFDKYYFIFIFRNISTVESLKKLNNNKLMYKKLYLFNFQEYFHSRVFEEGQIQKSEIIEAVSVPDGVSVNVVLAIPFLDVNPIAASE